MNTKRLTLLAMLIAIYSVLSYLTPVKLGNFKFTFEAYPILVASLLLGPKEGLIVGGVGSFIYQLLFSGYGITATTVLWILPHAISGLVVGLYAKANSFNLSFNKIVFISILSAIIVTTLNVFALFVDSKIYGYYSKTLVFANIPAKILIGIILAIIYSGTMPKIIKLFKDKSI